MFRFLRPRAFLTIGLLAALVSFAACSDNPVTDTNTDDPSPLVSGGIDAGVGDFELTVARADGPSDLLPGPFVLRGRNIHYDDALGALVADLSVVNQSRTSFPEPVGLTFVRLLPEGVEVLNPDNDVHGAGAQVGFDFANDDAMWTPGEESLPRQVQFKAERGRAVAFVARIDVGPRPEGGAIGGLVWNDRNKDGVPDPDEPGIGGLEVFMTRDGGPETSAYPEIHYRTRTDRTGRYHFDNLRAGLYRVQGPISPGCDPTTPTVLDVILVADDGHVSDFLDADFGCFIRETPPPDSAFVDVGDWVEATGSYVPLKDNTRVHGLLARILGVKDCDPVPPPVTLADTDECTGLPMELRGPVTDIARERRALRVMETWLLVPPDSLIDAANVRLMIPLDKIEVGDRVRAVVQRPGGPVALTALELAWWNEDRDMILGFVDHVDRDAEGRPLRLHVLDTLINLNNLTSAP